MRYQDRPLFYYSPDGEGGGVLEGGFSTAEYFTGDQPVTADAPAPVAEEKPAGAVADVKPEPSSETKPVEVADTKPAEAVAETKPSEPVKAAETTEAVPVANEAQPPSDLQLACDAFGITETDPAKQREALAVARAEAVEARERQVTERETARSEKAARQHTEYATSAAHTAIMEALKKQGFDTDRTPPPGKTIWDAETWADYEDPAAYVAQMLAGYKEIWDSPLTKSFLTQKESEAKAAYETTQVKLNEMATKYPQHASSVAQIMRDNNVPPEIFETVVRAEHEHVQKVIATTHSANTRLTAENETLKAQITGHADAISQAKEAGMAEGRAAALKELGDGRSLPNTVGVGTTAEKPFGVKDALALEDGWSIKDLEESMYATSNGHRR